MLFTETQMASDVTILDKGPTLSASLTSQREVPCSPEWRVIVATGRSGQQRPSKPSDLGMDKEGHDVTYTLTIKIVPKSADIGGMSTCLLCLTWLLTGSCWFLHSTKKRKPFHPKNVLMLRKIEFSQKLFLPNNSNNQLLTFSKELQATHKQTLHHPHLTINRFHLH